MARKIADTVKVVRVRDLPPWEPDTEHFDAKGQRYYIIAKHPMLYCARCGAENSANPGDYFMANPDTVFRCCGRPMALVRKQVTHVPV